MKREREKEMKRILGFLFCVLSVVLLVSCGSKIDGNTDNNEPEIVKLDAPVISADGLVVSWQRVTNVKGYMVSVNNNTLPVQTEASYSFEDYEVGTYKVKVKAITSDTSKYKSSEYSNELSIVVESLDPTTLWVVGDSTVCSFSDNYLYPRYGYATQLSNYISSNVTVKNIAMSGRSSKSYIAEDNYYTLTSNIKKGDYLMIGFGHNDEKSDDAERFTDASKPLSDSTSFKYSLYNYYVKVALDAGATPILCTPIVRLSKTNDYSGTNGHITSTGDYRKAIVELGEEVGVGVVDLTTLTKDLYESLGYDEAKYLHAITVASDESYTPDFNTVDGTHINIYGAKKIAYFVAKTLKASSSSFAKYVNKTLTEPSKDADLVKNPDYEYVKYNAIDVAVWKSEIAEAENTDVKLSQFAVEDERLFGTAFGDCGGDPKSLSNGYVAKEASSGVFEVGCSKAKGKITATADGIAGVFMQISKDDNFTATVNGTIKSIAQSDSGTSAVTKQAGFGLMLRDDCYTPNKVAISSNYVAAGLYLLDVTKTAPYTVNFKRENTALTTSGKEVSAFNVGDNYTFTITRVGQSVDVITKIGDTEYKNNYTDFDFFATDNDYFYLGMFSSRGIIVTFSNFTYTKTGTSQGA